MKKKFNPSAALGYKRIKPLYDKAVSDLIIVEADLADCRDSRDFFYDKACHQKAKLKAAGNMIGRLLKEREEHQRELESLGMGSQGALKRIEELEMALMKERKHRGVSMNSQMALHNEVQVLRNVSGVHRAARGKVEREKLAALTDVQKLKKAKRNWAIIAGAAVGLLVAAGYKLVEMGAI